MRIHMPMVGKKAIFLDRDGTINVEKNYIFRISDFEYIDGVIKGLKNLSEMGYLLIIVTNQSGIARGYYTEEDYFILDEWMRHDLLDKGIVVAASYYCPHLPWGTVSKYAVECKCRKPKTALYWEAVRTFNIDMARSFAIGDKPRDLSICDESAARGILLSDVVIDNCKYTVCQNWQDIIKTIIDFSGGE